MPQFLRVVLLFLWAGLLPSLTLAQQRLAGARQRSYLTKVFHLTDAQTRRLYERGLTAVRPEFFTQPVDSFPTDAPARARALPLGYYLVARAEGSQLVYWLHPVTDRHLTLVDNQVDLTLLVRDSLGQLLPDARVQLPSGQQVPFDARLQAYRLPGRRARPGLLAVTQAGRTTYHALEQAFPARRQRYHYPLTARRVLQRVAFGFPLGYLGRPVRSLVHQLRYASYTTTGLVGLLRSAFSQDVRDERRQQRGQGERWTGYLVLSKPRYLPAADTLRLKARVLRGGAGRPYRRPVEVWLATGYAAGRKVAMLRPTRPGSFEYTLPLTDTLGLRPDQTIRVLLRRAGGGAELLRTSFQLEDYELKNTRYTLRAAEPQHRRGTPQALFLRGQDANELNLLDARVRLSVTPQSVGRFPGGQVFVPDTLWIRAQPLDATGETRLNLPPAALPAADLTYRVQATFLNGDNERRTEAAFVNYALDPGQLLLELHHDTVVARLAGAPAGTAGSRAVLEVQGIRAADSLHTTLLRRDTVTLPLAVPLDRRATHYRLRDASGREAGLDLTPDKAGLLIRAGRTPDSLTITAENPRRLAFWYFLYRGNTLVERGFGPELHLARAAKSPEPWYVSVHYFWAGKLQMAEYNVPLPRHQLHIEADQPEVVYPGQKIPLRYTVRDGQGRPVPGADLTAYAYTSKFAAAAAPTVPDFEPPVAGRVSRRRFKLSTSFTDEAPARQPLPWGAWRRQLGLDSLRFYQFLYPDDGTFQEYRPAPGGITQLAPFVVDSGRVQPAVAVYVDDVPVYVAAVNGTEPFALVADSGRHTVAVRTPTHLVTRRNVYLRPLHKLTLGIDPHRPCLDLTVEKRGPLTLAEQEQLQRFLVLVERAGPHEQVLLRQGNRLQPLGEGLPGVRYASGHYSQYRYRNSGELVHLGGPFRPDSVLLRRSDGLRQRFLLEPLYRYSFARGLLKMRCVQGSEYGNLREATNFLLKDGLPLQDFAYTEADLRPQAATSYYRGPRPEPLLFPPSTTPAGQGRLVVRLPAPLAPPAAALPPVLYTLLTQPSTPSFARLLRYLPAPLHALPPGRYRLALLLADSSVLAPNADIQVRPDGTTYVQLLRSDLLPDNQTSRALRHRLGQLVRENLPKAPPTPERELREARREIAVAVPVVPQPGWRIQRGRIEDRTSGEGLPGVTVLLRGTTHGVSTNSDGSFELAVPPTGAILTISSIGFVSVERAVTGEDVVVALVADTKQLSEVVVTGYGAQRRMEVTGSVASLSLQGKVAGVVSTSELGGSAPIRIRGASTAAGAGQPLLIVDGLPFSGKLEDLSPELIAKLELLKPASAVAMYGSRASNGVLLITTKNGVPGRPAPGLRAGAEALGVDGLPLAGRDPRLALRRRFSDVGWWRPTLVTDANGQARTEVIVPDDITGWDTFVLASDDHARTGSFTQLLRSFKAVMGELAAPRFLLQGDRPQVIGKSLNYLPDTTQITTSFRVGEGVVRTQVHQLATAVLDTLTFTAPLNADSVAVGFGLTQASGYQDGELRQIPVLPVGTRERVGTFAVLTAPDTTLTLPVRPELGPVTVRLESDPLPTLLEEIRHVQRYAYLCNEQAASKLKTLLLEQRIRQALQQPFRQERDVERLIRHLLRGRRQPEGLWGTWPAAPASPWVTLHVVEALLAAEARGYKVPLDHAALRTYLLSQLDGSFADAATRRALAGTALGDWYFRTDDDRIRLLQVLHQLGATPDFLTYIRRLERETKGRQPLDRYLALATLRQQLHLPYQLDTLRRYRLRSELGGAFYADTLRPGTYFRYLLPDRLGATLLAYRLLRAQGGHEAELVRIRTYLLSQRRPASHWSSTYEAAQILETIVPDLVVPASGGLLARAQLSGAVQQEVRTFPFETTLPATAGPLTLRKEGGLPVYATAYQSFWNPAPAAQATPFVVATKLAGHTGSRVRLRAGQPIELEVTVQVPAEARYVLLEVPIPAGCSYGDKAPGNAFEVHREYLRHQVGMFMDVLPVGRHTFRVALQPRYRGRYTLNPAKAELMYFPTRFGRSASKQAVVE